MKTQPTGIPPEELARLESHPDYIWMVNEVERLEALVAERKAAAEKRAQDWERINESYALLNRSERRKVDRIAAKYERKFREAT